jgi:hypothetical protein
VALAKHEDLEVISSVSNTEKIKEDWNADVVPPFLSGA